MTAKKVNKYSAMYQHGYNNAAVAFSYIPDFKTPQEKIDFEAGLKEGYKTRDKIKQSTKSATGLPKGLSIKKVARGWEVVHTASDNRLMPFAYTEKQLAVDFAQRAGQVADWTRPFKDLQSESENLADLIRGGKKPGMFETVVGMPTTFPSKPRSKKAKSMKRTGSPTSVRGMRR